jgi:hypothetical protein
MERQEIYSKTEKGSEEMKSRKYKLPQAMRSLLIMIDGTMSVGAFLDQATALGNVATMLEELEQQGFIKKTDRKPVAPTAKPVIDKEQKKSGSGDGALVDVAGMFVIGGPREDKGEKQRF